MRTLACVFAVLALLVLPDAVLTRPAPLMSWLDSRLATYAVVVLDLDVAPGAGGEQPTVGALASGPLLETSQAADSDEDGAEATAGEGLLLGRGLAWSDADVDFDALAAGEVPLHRLLPGAFLLSSFLVLLAVAIGRRRRSRRPLADPGAALPADVNEVIAKPEARPVAKAPAQTAQRAEANALSNALAAIDVIDIELRTSLHNLTGRIGELGRLAGPGEPMPTPELGPIHDGLVRAVDGLVRHMEIAQEANAQARQAANGALERVRRVMRSAEKMDGAFQALGAAVPSQAPATPADVAQMARTFSSASAALTAAVVELEQELVDLDQAASDAATAWDKRVQGAADGEPAARRAYAALDRLASAATAIDRLAATRGVRQSQIGAQISELGRLADHALGRVKTVLAGFANREERRRYTRNKTELPARLLVDGAWMPCRLVCVSLGGGAVDIEIAHPRGTQGQLSIEGWTSLIPLVVTGTTYQRTHLSFQLNEGLSQSLMAFLDRVPVAA